MAVDPCHKCSQYHCVLGSRKQDCLAAFPNLRAIGNRKGFKATSYEFIETLPQSEQSYYDRMTGLKGVRDLL